MARFKPMISCKEATRLLSQAQDRDLGVGERTVMRMHTWVCVGCRNFGQQLGFLRQATRAFARGEGDVPGMFDAASPADKSPAASPSSDRTD